LDSASLATRKRLELLIENSVGKAQVARDARRLRLRRISTECKKTVFELVIAVHCRCTHRSVGARHLDCRLRHLECNRAKTPGIKDASACQVFRVPRSGILRQIPHFTDAID